MQENLSALDFYFEREDEWNEKEEEAVKNKKREKAEGNRVDIEWRCHASRSIEAIQSCLVTSMEG